MWIVIVMRQQILANWLQTYQPMKMWFNQCCFIQMLLHCNSRIKRFPPVCVIPVVVPVYLHSGNVIVSLFGRVLVRLDGDGRQENQSRQERADCGPRTQPHICNQSCWRERCVLQVKKPWSLYLSLTHTHMRTHARTHTNHTQADGLLGLNIMFKGTELCLHRIFFFFLPLLS